MGPIALATIRTSAVLGLRLVVQAGTLLLVARLLGPGDYGAFAGLAALATLFGAFSTLGTHLALVEGTARDSRNVSKILTWSVPITFFTGIFLLFVYLTTCSWIFGSSISNPIYAVAIGISEVILQPLVNLYSAPRLGQGHVASSQILQLIAPMLRLPAIVCIWIIAPIDPFGTYLVVYLTTSVAAYLFAHARLPTRPPGPKQWRLPTHHELLHTMGFCALNVTKTGSAEIDKALASRLLALDSAGIYSAAARIVGATTTPVSALSLASLPRLFRWNAENVTSSSTLKNRLLILSGIYGLLVASIMWMAAPTVSGLFGASYHDLSEALRWITIAIPGICIRTTSGNILMANGRPWFRAGMETFGLLAFVISSILMTRTLDLTGMACALMISEWMMAAIGIVMIIIEANRDRRTTRAEA